MQHGAIADADVVIDGYVSMQQAIRADANARAHCTTVRPRRAFANGGAGAHGRVRSDRRGASNLASGSDHCRGMDPWDDGRPRISTPITAAKRARGFVDANHCSAGGKSLATINIRPAIGRSWQPPSGSGRTQFHGGRPIPAPRRPRSPGPRTLHNFCSSAAQFHPPAPPV